MGLQSFHASRICRSRVHCTACKGDATWRAKIGKAHGLRSAEPWPCPRLGLGDLVSRAIKWGAGLLGKAAPKQCGGCGLRRRALNKITGA